MKTQSMAFNLAFLLLSCLAVPVLACCPPPQPPCYRCEDGVWVNNCSAGQKCCTDSGSYCCESDETCCEGTCCPKGKCCVDGVCLLYGCHPTWDLVESGECGCYAFECEGGITETFIWYCQEYDGGCPTGTECVQTDTLLCFTTRTRYCIEDCLAYGSECALSVHEYGPKAPRCLCGCCPTG